MQATCSWRTNKSKVQGNRVECLFESLQKYTIFTTEDNTRTSSK
jgi:hypothetical protein